MTPTTIGGHDGSSPLARGLPLARPSRALVRRIIPARAGFTFFLAFCFVSFWDHPRSRGVYATPEGATEPEGGSSPLARGLRWHEHGRGHRPGIIPARAGFTYSHGRTTPTTRDHPRSRGVYRPRGGRRRCRWGSSPLARGLLLPVVGFPCGLVDHPRSRGVYPVGGRPHSRARGSSPLARGLRLHAVARHVCRPDHPRSRGVYQ